MPRLRTGVRLLLNGMFLLPCAFHPCRSAQIADAPPLTHGIASGDVTSHRVVIWSRAKHEVYLHVAYDRSPDFSRPKTARPIFVTHESDYGGQILLAQLQPSAHCYCRVWFTAEPAGNQREQSGCAIFTSMAALKPDFFVANGDMIYADDGGPPERQLAPLGARSNEPLNSPPPVWKNIPGRFPGVRSLTLELDRPQPATAGLSPALAIQSRGSCSTALLPTLAHVCSVRRS